MMENNLRKIIIIGYFLLCGKFLLGQKTQGTPQSLQLNPSVYNIKAFSLKDGIVLKTSTRNPILDSKDRGDVKVIKLNSKLEIDYECLINSGGTDNSYSNIIELKNGDLLIIANEKHFDTNNLRNISKIHFLDKTGKIFSSSELQYLQRSFIFKMKEQAIILGTSQKPLPALDRSMFNMRYELFFSRIFDKVTLQEKTPLYFSFLESTRQINSAISYRDSFIAAVLHKVSPSLLNYGPCVKKFDESYIAAFDNFGEIAWEYKLPNLRINKLDYINHIIKGDDHFELIISTEHKVPYDKGDKAWCMPNRDKTIRDRIQDFKSGEPSDFEKASHPPNIGSDSTTFVIDYYPPTYKTVKLSFMGVEIGSPKQLYDAKDYGTLLEYESLSDNTLIILSRKEKNLYIHKYLNGEQLWIVEFENIISRPISSIASLAHLPDNSIILAVLTSFERLELIKIDPQGRCLYPEAKLIKRNSR